MNYTCPYCDHHSTITDPNKHSFWNKLYLKESTLGEVGINVGAITCPNPECNKLKLTASLTGVTAHNTKSSTIHHSWKLLPESEAKILPDYIPTPIQEDYYEACKIRDLSSKASATLARRCLQGMIRDFHNISKSTLFEEIKELNGKIDQDVWESIDAVREVGNIGAHMKKDINIIVDVEPEEAQLLIGLIEQLIDDWYVVREDRRKRSKLLKDLAIAKKASSENQA